MTIPPITSTPSTPPERPEAPRPIFSALRIAASGLSAQRARMEIVAQNLANAETTRTQEGGPYRRQVVRLEAVEPEIVSGGDADNAQATGNDNVSLAGGVRVAGIERDMRDGPLVYDPGHPDADSSGYVRMPNVDMTTELLDLMNARRIYEANATVFQVAKAMLRRAIDI